MKRYYFNRANHDLTIYDDQSDSVVVIEAIKNVRVVTSQGQVHLGDIREEGDIRQQLASPHEYFPEVPVPKRGRGRPRKSETDY